MKIMAIPGNGNADVDSEIWFPWLKKELEKLKKDRRLGVKELDVIIKNMPDPDIARRNIWVPFIEQHVGNDPDAILIGHSSGALAVMRYLENHKAQGAVLVGACYTDLGDAKEKASGYYDDEWQWEKIRKNAEWIMQFASTNDPYIPIEEARHVRDMLNTEYHEYTDQGHFSSDIKKISFPELIEVLKKKLKS